MPLLVVAMASANQPTTEECRLSPMCLRVDGNAGIALEAVALIFKALGGVDVKTQTWTVTAFLPHPDGVCVNIKVVAHSVAGEKTYLRCNVATETQSSVVVCTGC